MIVIPWGVVSHGECWFDDEPESGVDVVNFIQTPEPRNNSFTKFYTLVIDLDKNPEELLGAMNSTTRNEVRRAEGKDLLKQEWVREPSAESVEEFSDFYDEFARSKSIHLIARPKIRAYRKAGVLRFSKIMAPDNTLLNWNALIENKKRLRWLWGPSFYRTSDDQAFRQMLGRATRFNHYCCMLRAKEAGIEMYDLGGWHPGKVNQSLLAVNRFKEGFGGQMMIDYTGDLPLTLRGRVYLLARPIWQHIADRWQRD